MKKTKTKTKTLPARQSLVRYLKSSRLQTTSWYQDPEYKKADAAAEEFEAKLLRNKRLKTLRDKAERIANHAKRRFEAAVKVKRELLREVEIGEITPALVRRVRDYLKRKDVVG